MDPASLLNPGLLLAKLFNVDAKVTSAFARGSDAFLEMRATEKSRLRYARPYSLCF